MATEEEIRQLAHAIWEREGCPEGKDKEHWKRAEQFLENQEVAEAAGAPSLASLSKQLVDIQRAVQRASRTSNLYFSRSFAVSMMAIAITLILLKPPVTFILGLNSTIVGGIIGLLTWVFIVASDVEREPGRFDPRRIRRGLWIMLAGIAMILVGSLLNYHVSNIFPVALVVFGFGVFAIGIWAAFFSRRRQAQEGSDVTERFLN
jgi:hypothetical protein